MRLPTIAILLAAAPPPAFVVRQAPFSEQSFDEAVFLSLDLQDDQSVPMSCSAPALPQSIRACPPPPPLFGGLQFVR
jgi:hypothetical protein